MGYQDIKPGRYKAKAKAGQFTESAEKKTPCVAILCEIDMEHGTEQMWWQGWLSLKESKDGKTSLERTFEALTVIGYDEEKGHLPDGSIPESHFFGNEFDVTIENEPYESPAGSGNFKDSMKIKWINKPGSQKFAALQPQEVQNVLAGIDVRKAMMAARGATGNKRPTATGAAPKAPPAQPGPPPVPEGEEIPF